LASGRIMTDWLQKEIGSTASDIRFRLGMWASWSAYNFESFTAQADTDFKNNAQQLITLLTPISNPW
jgi:hypothetical protein